MFQPLYVRPLTISEREALKRASKSSSKEESLRANVILLSAAGRNANEISQTIGFHPSNVKKWIRNFNREGLDGLAVKKRGPHGGPRPKFTADQIQQITLLAKTSPQSLGYRFSEWTPQKLATAARERGIVESISHVTIRQILRRQDSLSSMKAQKTSGLEQLSYEEGRRALTESDFERAVKHFYTVLGEGGISVEEEAVTRSLLSQALEELSRYEEAYKVIGKYEDGHALALLSSLMRARVKLRIGWVNSWLRNYPKAIAILNDALKLFLELQDELGVSEAHYALGRAYINIDEYRIARDHFLAAAKSQRSNANRELLARVYHQLGNIDFHEGAFSASKENNLKALELAEGTTNTNLLGMILLNLGISIDESYLGKREKAAEYERRAIEYLEKGGHKDYLALAYNNLGENLRESGLWDEAIQNFNKAIDIAQRYAQPNYEATARVSLSEILCAKGVIEEAEAHLKKSLELIGTGSDKWLESNALRILAIVYKDNGRIEEALSILRQAMRLSTSIGDMHGVTRAQVGLAEIHFLQGGHDQAKEYLELAQGRLKEEQSLTISGLIQRLTGQIEAACGRLAEARQHIAQSISIFTTTEMPYDIAKSRYAMGSLLIKGGDLKGAETILLQAKETFENLGARPDLELTLKALASIGTRQEKEPEAPKVTPPSDVLLMQRLIGASASRELLMQELASVIYENFPAAAVMVCRLEESGQLEPLAIQGIIRTEADNLCKTIDTSACDGITRLADGYAIRIGDAIGLSLLLYIRVTGSLDIARLQPLLEQVELGLELNSLRVAARSATYTTVEQRVQTVMPGFIVASPSMFDVIDKIYKIRTSDVTVLITGESGTGKELVARYIHGQSARARAIFLPFNCTATPKDIIDSQLFGHRRGAFTGATANYPGIIKAADGGTLFLDEIGDLSLEVQPKLMRFLQEGEIQPLGETKPIRVDVRILAATNTDLERAVEDGRFREDLFHRLNIIRIHVPPLRERRQEIPVLAAHFLDHFSSRSGKRGVTMTQEAIDALSEYDWPGNVRQLRNEIERVVAYAHDGARISREDLSPEVVHPRRQLTGDRSRTGFEKAYDRPIGTTGNGRYDLQSNGHRGQKESVNASRVKLKEATAALEKQLIEEALVRNRNNLSRTAVDLGLSRRGLRLKLAQLGIQRDERL
ncbi:MAG TPA: sigma 54-interacting transcriptional regulator [Blastocatellia bacterium]|nr:sigma 54-interacting transcriptional regulator [Blastocatellia bacterium]